MKIVIGSMAEPFRLRYVHTSCGTEQYLSPVMSGLKLRGRVVNQVACAKCKKMFPVTDFTWSNLNEGTAALALEAIEADS